MMTWKTHAEYCRGRRLAVRFNGATSMMTWKTSDRGVANSTRAWSFNGATSMMTWKTRSGHMTAGTVESTLQWGHVDDDVEDGTTLATSAMPCQGFNGATSMMTWKTSTPSSRYEEQYGCFNGATSMMTWKTLREIAPWKSTVASMGPRR